MNFTPQLLENYSLYKEKLLIYRHFQPEQFNEVLSDIIKVQNSNFTKKKIRRICTKKTYLSSYFR